MASDFDDVPSLEGTTLDPRGVGQEADDTTRVVGPPVKTSRQGELLDRFRLERPIGEGGMGQVWEAWDPRLERRVAIKRLRVADPAARRRFLREARLQATLAHPGICPVFEVGLVDGEPFLVMPRLEGLPLDRAVDGASLEHKLNLMRQVAEAVHTAHGRGLIHRDLKPGNILVESPEDGPQRPVVLDFGIARPLEGAGLTASGEILGTPSFMAPEQVEGDSAQLDRRTDVYALGATLYALLAGRPPHPGQGASLLIRIVRDEPARLHAAGIPSEVEAILFKCLEKDKDERYDSALALAEDLGRYLAGRPVRARPVTRRIRLVKWLRRHRAAARVTVLAALLSVAALTWGAWSAWRSEERQRLARRFGAQIEEIEALARYSHLLPLHDVRPDQAELRRRLDAIRAEADDGDPAARALAHHALGRGHLALDELETARRHLGAAHDLDPDHPEIKADLGRVLSELYRERLTTLERTGDRTGRESLREQLSDRLAGAFRKPGEQQKQWQRTLAEPARALLSRGRSPGAREALELDALILFHDGRPEAALDLLAAAPPAPAWAYERRRLEGDIRRSWAVSLYFGGAADEAARRELEAARRAYGEVLAVAQSHAAVLRDDAQAILLLVSLGLAPPGQAELLLDQARQSLRSARQIHPEELQTWLWAVRLELVAASHELDRARDPGPHLEAALDAARQGLEIDDQVSALWYELGRVHERLARRQQDRGEDPAARFEQAAQAFARVAPEDRDYAYFTSLGILHMVRAGHLAERGLDAGAAYRSAITAYRSAAELHSAPFAALANLGVALFDASALDGPAPGNLLARAMETFEQAHRLRPDHMVPFYYLGLCRLRLARTEDTAGGFVNRALLELATADFDRATELDGERFEPWSGLGEAFYLGAIDAHIRGGDPAPFFDGARRASRRALELAPEEPIALLNAGLTANFHGEVALNGELDPTDLLAESEELCRRSLKVRHDAISLLCLGSVRRYQAEHRLKEGDLDGSASRISEAVAFLEELLELDSDQSDAHRLVGELFTLEALRLRQKNEDPAAAFERARGALDSAFMLGAFTLGASEPGDATVFLHLADTRWHLERGGWLHASGNDAMLSLSAGRQSLSRVLARAPEWSEAHRLKKRFAQAAEGLSASPADLSDPVSRRPARR